MRRLLFLALLGCSGPMAREVRRAAYVRDLGSVLAEPGPRDQLISMVQRCLVTDLVPYGMGRLLETSAARARLVEWLDDVHRRGGRVIAPVAGRDRLAALIELGIERFDGLVTEYEYWNRGDREAAFDELLALLAAMRATGRPSGAYLGYPTAAEATKIAAAVDFVFLDYSVSEPARAWRHVHTRGGPLRDRYGWFARAQVAIWPILYAEGEVAMGDALRLSGLRSVEKGFKLAARADPIARGADVAGFVYFTVATMPDDGRDACP